jgi:cell wall-associated NlpC family hydrolase
MDEPDRRLNVYRADLADQSLRSRIKAARYVEGHPAQVAAPVLSLHREPAANAMQLTQVLMGETLKVFDVNKGWSWVKLDRDGYVGYVHAEGLSGQIHAPTHEVATLSTIIYPRPDLKTQPVTFIPMLARVAIVGEEGEYAALATGGYVYKRHLQPVERGMGDLVNVAERFLFAPYLWGGKTIHGLDCSGLVQLALNAVGHPCPRDSDMQEETLGKAIAPKTTLQRGDLVFWSGHVGIMADAENLLHANGFHMMVAVEPLAAAIKRFAKTGKLINSLRRI